MTSGINRGYTYPDYKPMAETIKAGLKGLTFDGDTTIVVSNMYSLTPREPKLSIEFKGEIYKPNFDPSKGPIRSGTFYTLDVKKEPVLTQGKGAGAAREEDLAKIQQVIDSARPAPQGTAGGRRRRKTRRATKKTRRSHRRHTRRN